MNYLGINILIARVSFGTTEQKSNGNERYTRAIRYYSMGDRKVLEGEASPLPLHDDSEKEMPALVFKKDDKKGLFGAMETTSH